MPTTRMLAASLLVSLACATPQGGRAGGAQEAGTADPRATLLAFVDALAAGRWDAAYPLLSTRWRSGATPSRLASDFAAAGPIGADAVERVRALLAAGAAVRADGRLATLPVGGDRAARLLLEDGAWRVDQLE